MASLVVSALHHRDIGVPTASPGHDSVMLCSLIPRRSERYVPPRPRIYLPWSVCLSMYIDDDCASKSQLGPSRWPGKSAAARCKCNLNASRLLPHPCHRSPCASDEHQSRAACETREHRHNRALKNPLVSPLICAGNNFCGANFDLDDVYGEGIRGYPR
jgi:hypothetical protein